MQIFDVGMLIICGVSGTIFFSGGDYVAGIWTVIAGLWVIIAHMRGAIN